MTPRFAAWLDARALAESNALNKLLFAAFVVLIWYGVSTWREPYATYAKRAFIFVGGAVYVVMYLFGWSV